MNFAIWDKFAIWANCGVGEFHHILRCASSRTLPLRRTQKNLCHARDAICIYICQRSDNTRVGANCNSPIHMGEFVIWVKYNVGELGCGRICITYSAAPARGLCPYDPRKQIHTMPVMFFVYLHVYLYVITWYLRTSRKHTCRGELQFALSCMRAIRPLLYESNSPTKPTKGIGNKKVKNYHSNSSLFTLHFSLFTLH